MSVIKYRSDLYKIIDLSLPGVELGVAEGNFSRDMLNWGIAKLYSVDAWTRLNQRGDGGFDQQWHDDNYVNTVKLLSQFGERSVIIKGLTYEVAQQFEDNHFGIVYLDADHSYEGVIRDLQAWFPKVVCGGIIASHDFYDIGYGVKKAFEDFTQNRFELQIIPENKLDDAGCYFKKIC